SNGRQASSQNSCPNSTSVTLTILPQRERERERERERNFMATLKLRAIWNHLTGPKTSTVALGYFKYSLVSMLETMNFINSWYMMCSGHDIAW
ncbi:hypothetical protein U1Q18_010991, partial [Sarracenia purpurea var. burkii]